MRFDALPIHPATMSALEAMGFEETTPIQEQAIPALLQGKDILAQAQTGTGKTAAFGIPLIEAARNGKRGIVLTPTRELAKQVQRELQAISHGSKVDVVCLIGGASFGEQVRAIQHHPDAIFVATPGRVCDHLQRQTLNLSTMGILVLDEADEMLSMGFQDELETIVKALPAQRQTMLFTATMPQSISRLAHAALKDPLTIKLEAGKGGAATSVDQRFTLIAGRDRPEAIRRILIAEEPEATLVFCKTRDRVEELAEQLKPLGSDALHGGLAQAARDTVMDRFRKGRTKILVATDVAARGLDVEGIELVMHDDAPADLETYIHRIGRTGRAGRKGRSILLIPPGRVHQVAGIRRAVGKLEDYKVPDLAALAKLRIGRILLEVQGVEPGPAAKDALAMAKGEGMSAEDIALRALELILAQDVEPEEPVNAKAAQPKTVALSLKVGAVDGIRPGSIVGTLINQGGLRAEDIGRIDILPQLCFVEVPSEAIPMLVDRLSRVFLSQRKLMPREAPDWKFKPTRR